MDIDCRPLLPIPVILIKQDWKRIANTPYVKEKSMVKRSSTKAAVRQRPGGSNVGKYKNVKSFAGPSGGAPSGSFPINTRKRAKAALAYAHNAPKPSGIRAAVHRKYPDLGKPNKKDK